MNASTTDFALNSNGFETQADSTTMPNDKPTVSPPPPLSRRLDAAGVGERGADDERRGVPSLDRSQAFLTLPPDQAARLYPELARAHEALAMLDQHLLKTGTPEIRRRKALDAAKNAMAKRLALGLTLELPHAPPQKKPPGLDR